MTKHLNYKKHNNKPGGLKLTKKEFQWFLAAAIFFVCYIIYFVFGFISHCIITWPIRFDINTCWHEQINPAKEKAAEKAAPFVP